MPGLSLQNRPLHLGPGATAIPQPEFTGGMDWYEAYDARHGGDGPEGRLVSQFDFTGNWDSWEMHPAGDEVVACLRGEMTLHQEFPDGSQQTLVITPGQYAINPPGVWHTADIADHATALFITPGWGTETRPR